MVLHKIDVLSKGKGYVALDELHPYDRSYVMELIGLKLVREVPEYEPEYQQRYILTDLGSKELIS
jgi:hypothetical protein